MPNHRIRSLIAGLVVLSQFPVAAQDWYVDANSPSVPGTGTSADPFRTIQDGIGAAATGQTVLVRTGTYTGAGNRNLDFGGVDIELVCQGGCTIDAENEAVAFHFHNGETNLAAVRNFRIANGRGNPSGGGMLIQNSSPTIFNCVFDRANAGVGGAVDVNGGSPQFLFCSFFRNHADDCGGALYAQSADVVLTNCIFDQNTSALDGGALCLFQAQVDVAGSFFLRSAADGNGGAVWLNASTAVLQSSTFVSNQCGDAGGAVHADDVSTLTVKHSQFTLNAAIDGGAIQCVDSQATLTNDLFAFNRADGLGGGLHLSACNPQMTNATLVYNAASISGGAVFGQSSGASIVNTISRFNLPQEFDFDEQSAPIVSRSNVQGGWDGVAVTDEDPLFGPGPAGQFYLWHTSAGQLQDSPMIDAGQTTPETAELSTLTTRRDNLPDVAPVDIGFHYAPSPFSLTPNDSDRDDDVDLIDVQRLLNCFTGSAANNSAPLPSPCGRFDFDSNLTVELEDYAEFLHDMTGP